MSIGDLYSAANVVTGQAAVFVAPVNTPNIDMAKFNIADPFDLTAWPTYTFNVGSITSATFTFSRRSTGAGTATAVTSSLTISGLTTTALQTALQALATLGGAGAGTVIVTGTTTTGPFYISLDEAYQDGVLTMTPTGGAGSSLVAGWNAVGATEQGWQLGADKSTQTINIEEQSTAVGTTITNQSITLQGALSEDITKTLLLALNATAAKVAATVTTPAYDEITLTDDVLRYAVGAVLQNAEGYGRLVYAPAWTQLSNVSAAFRRAAGQRLYAVSFATVCNTNQISIRNFTAPHS